MSRGELDPVARVAGLEVELASVRRVLADRDREFGWLEADVGRQREVNARLREVIAAKDAEVAGLAARVEWLGLQMAELSRRVSQSSQNSSVPPSQDRPGHKKPKNPKKARDRDRRGGDGSAGRKPGGQPGHPGAGLEPAGEDELDDKRVADPPRTCRGCAADLADPVASEPAGTAWTQVWDLPPIRLTKTRWELPKRRCAGCGLTTCAAVPGVGWAGAGRVVYGPNVQIATALLNHYGTVAVERTAELMAMLLGAPVSTGFVSHATARLDQALAGAGWDGAMQAALAQAPVLGADETPVVVPGHPGPGAPHVVTVQAPETATTPGLVWLTAVGARSQQALGELAVLKAFTGVLVRDDYAGYYRLDTQLEAVQLCGAHLIRKAQEVFDIDATQQAWAGSIIDLLRHANHETRQARARGDTSLDPDLLTDLRSRYDQAVAEGLQVNTGAAWHGRDAHHPGYNLAKRLRDKAGQVWLFTTRLDVPFTNNASEQALRMSKVRQKISGCWHTLTTLDAWCRIRSYLTTTTNHGINAAEALTAALAGTPWLPATT